MQQSRTEQSPDVGPRPSFSIVVVTHEREHLFRQSVESIKKAVAAYPGETEIIAVDSSETSALGDTSANVTEIHVPDANKVAKKRNLGLQAATNDWIVYVDDDCTVAERALGVFASVIEDAGDSVAGYFPVTEFVGDRALTFECCHGTHFFAPFKWPREGGDQTWGPLTLAVFDREALLAVEGFDDSFASAMGGEDIDLGLRLTERGYRLVGIPETLVYHTTATWNSFWGNCRRFFEYGRGEAELNHNHPDRSHLKLNTVSPLIIVTVVATMLAVSAWGGVGLLVLVLFPGYSLVISADNYRRQYNIPYRQTLLLRVYDYATATGNIANINRVIPSDFFRLKPSLELAADAPYPLGREQVVYLDELYTYAALPLTFLTIYLLTAV
jgi:GT2 family glycosyltransferase